MKNSWSFDPEVIDADLGDTLKMRFVNEDDYDHGLGIDAYGVSQRIPARTTVDIPPFVVSKAGDFQFYCSVSCGEGIAKSGVHKGEKRGHFDQIGTICVHKTPGDRVCMNNTTPVPNVASLQVPKSECTFVPPLLARCQSPEEALCERSAEGVLSWKCDIPVNTTLPK